MGVESSGRYLYVCLCVSAYMCVNLSVCTAACVCGYVSLLELLLYECSRFMRHVFLCGCHILKVHRQSLGSTGAELLAARGNLKMGDFGIAKVLNCTQAGALCLKSRFGPAVAFCCHIVDSILFSLYNVPYVLGTIQHMIYDILLDEPQHLEDLFVIGTIQHMIYDILLDEPQKPEDWYSVGFPCASMT